MNTYNEVTPRVSLEKPTGSIDYKNPANWPKELKGFVNRIFMKANKLKFNPKQKNKLQEELKAIISLAISQNKILENNWESQDLPCFNGSMKKIELACKVSNGNPPKENKSETAAKQKENGLPKNEDKSAKVKAKAGLSSSKVTGVRPTNILHDGYNSSGDESDDYDPEREFESSLQTTKKTLTKRPTISIGSLPPLKKMKKAPVPTETPHAIKKQNSLKVTKTGVLLKPSSTPEPKTPTKFQNSHENGSLTPEGRFLASSSITTPSQPVNTVLPFQNTSPALLSDKQKIQLRGKRFERELSAPLLSGHDDTASSDRHLEKPLIGTCQKLEKNYLRLTSQPNPEVVRPLSVLKKTRRLLEEKYLEGATYPYLCDQFKSLRQDLTVQHIKNEFTILVYEYHCRLAIEFNDLGEFNQCQSQLKLLYDDSHLSEVINSDKQMLSNKYEFMSYRVLYYIITNNFSEAFDLKLNLIESGIDLDENEFLRESYKLLEDKVNNDYFSFFKRIRKIRELDSQDKSKTALDRKTRFFFLKLLTPILLKERMNALSIIAKSYRLISTTFLKEQLYFGYDDLSDEDTNFNKFIDNYKLQEFIMTDTNGGRFFEGHKSKLVVESIRQKMFSKIDIKGQI